MKKFCRFEKQAHAAQGNKYGAREFPVVGQ